jgi:hypothetical protein
MDNAIVGVTAKRQERIVPLHPEIEHIVEKEIGQDRACDSTHTIDNFEFDSNFKYSRNWNNIVVDK